MTKSEAGQILEEMYWDINLVIALGPKRAEAIETAARMMNVNPMAESLLKILPVGHELRIKYGI